MTITSGMVVPRDALEGLSQHRVDLRLTKSFNLGGNVKASVIGEVFNMFNRANYRSFTANLSTATFGQPTGADVPRQGQLAFRFIF